MGNSPHQVPRASSTAAATRAGCTREAIAFYFVSLAISWPALLLWRLPPDFQFGDTRAAREAYAQVTMFFGFGPMLAALIVAFAYGRMEGLRSVLRRLVIWRVSPGWFAAALIIPIIPQWLGIAAWSAFTGADLHLAPWSVWLSRWLQISVAAGLISAGEEIGWRGFMLPRILVGRSWLQASLVVGIPWAIWHYPVWGAVNWAMTGSIATTATILLAGTITAVSLSVLVTWIFTKSRGSILPTMLLHGSINANMNIFYEEAGARAESSLSLLMCTTACVVATAVGIVLIDRANQRSTSGQGPS